MSGVFRGYAPEPSREREGFKGRENPRFGVGGFTSPLSGGTGVLPCK